MNELYEITAKELAEALGKVKRIILRRAKKEGWFFKKRENKTRIFLISCLPDDIRMAVYTYRALSGLRANIERTDRLIREAQKQRSTYVMFLREMEKMNDGAR